MKQTNPASSKCCFKKYIGSVCKIFDMYYAYGGYSISEFVVKQSQCLDYSDGYKRGKQEEA